MQIRLTIVDAPPPPGTSAPERTTRRDVSVTAPAGTPLAAVASALAPGGAEASGGLAFHAGAHRLDAERCALGEPPLIDGAVLTLGAPGDPEPGVEAADAPTRLHVVGGPDAGGVHLLHGGRVRVGRSAEADIALDDPDVSRFHCAVTLASDGRVSVADLGSTNGTTLDGSPVGTRPVRFPWGSLLRVGESTLRVAPGGVGERIPTEPDGQGRVRLLRRTDGPETGGDTGGARRAGGGEAAADGPPDAATRPTAPTAHALGTVSRTGSGSDGRAEGGRPRGRDEPAPAGPSTGAAEPRDGRRRGGFTAWARRLAGGRGEPSAPPSASVPPEGRASGRVGVRARPDTWPDPAALLLTALGPGPRLWERDPAHPQALTVRVGTADRVTSGGDATRPGVPVTAGLREAGALGLAGPRPRLAGLARAVLAQLAAAHPPDTMEIVLVAADGTRPTSPRVAEWSWLGWLPHARPARGQDCRLLLAFDTDQAAARVGELLRRLDDRASPPQGPGAPCEAPGACTVLVVDGDPGEAALRDAVARLAAEGPGAGIHVVCLVEVAPASASSGVAQTYEAARAASPAFAECGTVALLSGEVATSVRLLRVEAAGPVLPGTLGTADAVSVPWAERFARALAPLRPDPAGDGRGGPSATPLPRTARLLDELGLARATPAALRARWAQAADDPGALGGRARAVLGAGPRGPVAVDLAADGPHLLVEGPRGSGRTELLRALVASLASAERPDRLAVVLVDGRGGVGSAVPPGDGLGVCTDVPHVVTHLVADDPVRMREFAQALGEELRRRAEAFGDLDFVGWHTARASRAGEGAVRDLGAERTPPAGTRESPGTGTLASRDSDRVPAPPRVPGFSGPVDGLALRSPADARPVGVGSPGLGAHAEAVPEDRPEVRRPSDAGAPPAPRLVVVVDDLDAVVAPPLGAPGRPAAGSVARVLEAVSREGERLGVHLVVATAPDGPGSASEPARAATLRVVLRTPESRPEEPAPGRGWSIGAGGGEGATPFQAGRITGRIPRTATARPTVVPLDWRRVGDPPTGRPVRELGNGPTDLALLASALQRAAREVVSRPPTSTG
ncbi:FHA domain-containing protein [Streptomyces sp. HSG2]|uniref:FHA domain-containing protein n=1 Tax=Streptomyces sp. HSG2 TaxID=2797167 RepID=UPI001905D235|nr:FHA domain-containing protein [Streptomyces sp. HSG2]